MIKLNVTKHPEVLGIGPMHFHFNSITLGTGHNNNVVIKSKSIEKTHILFDTFLVNNEHYLSIESASETAFYFVNSKKILGKKILKKGDVIKVDEIVFEIQDFKYDKAESFSKALENKYIALYDDPVERAFLEMIETNLKELSEIK